MHKLYWSKGTACLAPQIVLEEAGLDYQLVHVDIARGEHRRHDYLEINPVGKVPALVLPDGEIVTESAAISLLLAERHPETGLVPAIVDPRRPLFLRTLIYLTNTVQVAYKRFYYPERFTSVPDHAPEVRVTAIDSVIESWRAVDDQLTGGGPFLLGERASLADIYMLMMTTWFDPIGDLRDHCPAICAACDLVRQRPAVRKCLDMQDGLSIGRV